jgi:hypothetical protein
MISEVSVHGWLAPSLSQMVIKNIMVAVSGGGKVLTSWHEGGGQGQDIPFKGVSLGPIPSNQTLPSTVSTNSQ